MYTGTAVERFAYNAMMGACRIHESVLCTVLGENTLTMTPNIRLAIAVRLFPVPRSFAGNISGDAAYKTPNMIYALGISDNPLAS